MSSNPLQGLLDHPRCGAHSRRTGQPCRNPAMANGRCRMHGGKSPGAPKGKGNGNYRHGGRSKEAQSKVREWRAVLRAMRQLLRQARN